MEQDSLSVLKAPLPTWGGVTPEQRLRKEWQESESAALAALQKSEKTYAIRHGDARLNADPEAKVGAGNTKGQVRSKALEALKKVAEEGKNSEEMPAEEVEVVNILKDGLRDYIDDALDEAERYKRVDRSEVKRDFKWEVVGNFNEFPALHRSRLENGPGGPYKGGNNANHFEVSVFAMSDLGLILESPRDGQWSRFGGKLPVILDVLPGSAAAHAHPRIKRGFRLDTVNGTSLATLGPEGFKRVQGVRPLRLGVCSVPLDYVVGAGKECQNLRPDIFARTMAVDFLRDFGPSAEEKDAVRALKQTRFEHTVPWSDSKGLGDLERRVTRLHHGLQQTGWPPGTKTHSSVSPTLGRAGSKAMRAMSKGSTSFAANSQASFAASGRQSPGGRSPAHVSPAMNLSASAPHVGFSLGSSGSRHF
jgi:hypothetical protein